jgi:signal transduction histidine kinase
LMLARGEATASNTVLGLWFCTVLAGVVVAVLLVVGWGDLNPVDAYPAVGLPIAGVVYATLGALIVRRVRNNIGWMLLWEGLAITILGLTSLYSIVGVVSHPGLLPAAKAIGSFSEWIFAPIVMGLAYVLLVFPTGVLPSPRWRPVAAVAIAVTGLALIGFIVTPRLVALPAPGGVSLRFANPFGIQSLSHGISTALVGTLPSLGVFAALFYAVALAALVVRYRSGEAELRQQIKWVAFVAVGVVVCQAGLALALTATGPDSSLTTVVGFATAMVSLFGIPIAITIAILKHGLYQIDVIINRTVVYGLLAAAVTAVYVGVVIGVGTVVGHSGGPALTIVAAAAIALLFQPLRRQAQRAANRLVYGERATPYQVLSDFAENMAGTLGLDEMLDRMVSVLADGTGATRVDVWIRVGSGLRPAATWPQGSTPPAAIALATGGELPSIDGATRAIAVRQGDELLGALALQKPRNEPLSITEDTLLQDLASQAGLVLRNVRLTAELRAKIEELRASRRRLVRAQDEERRKIERNLHDGAQQQLVALNVQLALLGRSAEDAERVKVMANQLQGSLQDALDDLRDLARGIYPPLLADKGLAVALEAQARKAAVMTTVESNGVGRYSEDVEAAVYFCALEALQNVAKYANATSAVIRLTEARGNFLFEVQDDGRGFNAEEIGYGTGLQGMADRLDAIGGVLELRSEPARGTLVRGRIDLS